MAVRYTHDLCAFDPTAPVPSSSSARRRWVRAKREARRAVVSLLLDRDGDRCRGCGRLLTRIPGDETELTVDHIVPYSRGGDVLPVNLHLLCRACNEAKADHLPGEPGWPPFLLVPTAVRPQLPTPALH